jgi:hypothetical protein
MAGIRTGLSGKVGGRNQKESKANGGVVTLNSLYTWFGKEKDELIWGYVGSRQGLKTFFLPRIDSKDFRLCWSCNLCHCGEKADTDNM